MMRLSRLVKSGKIVSVEPLPDNLKALKKIKEFLKLKNVMIVNKAISSTNGHLEIHIPTLNRVPITTRASLVVNQDADVEQYYKLFVETTSLDSLVESQKLYKVDFIKIDTEGHDIMVLNSGEKTILKFRPLIKAESNCLVPDLEWLFQARYYPAKMLKQEIITDLNQLKKTPGDTYLIPEEKMNKFLAIKLFTN